LRQSSSNSAKPANTRPITTNRFPTVARGRPSRFPSARPTATCPGGGGVAGGSLITGASPTASGGAGMGFAGGGTGLGPASGGGAGGGAVAGGGKPACRPAGAVIMRPATTLPLGGTGGGGPADLGTVVEEVGRVGAVVVVFGGNVVVVGMVVVVGSVVVVVVERSSGNCAPVVEARGAIPTPMDARIRARRIPRMPSPARALTCCNSLPARERVRSGAPRQPNRTSSKVAREWFNGSATKPRRRRGRSSGAPDVPGRRLCPDAPVGGPEGFDLDVVVEHELLGHVLDHLRLPPKCLLTWAFP
jgi:hypothetical protein